MGKTNRKDLELNEARWWSNWAQMDWLGSSGYLMTSEDLREPFFNRACILDCRGAGATIAWAEDRLIARGMVPIVTIFDSCTGAATGLGASGYRSADTMTVLLSRGLGKSASAAQVTINERPDTDSWTRAYLEAFYGDQELAPHVTPIVARLQKLKAVTLLEAMTGDETAGVLAIFRTEGMAGVYCVGTTSEHRRMGVAGTLLSRAKDIAGAEGRLLFLQSLASDGTLRYYLERGFRATYSKQLLSRGETSNANEKERI